MRSLIADLRYSLRTLARGRFTAAALLILTLGIGATTAVFSFVYAILLRPLPYDAPERLTLLWSTTARDQQAWRR